MKALATLHIADLFRDPAMKWPTRLDWSKIPQILAGAWPKPIPPRYIFKGGNTLQLAEEFAQALHAPFIAIDTEFDRDTHELTLLGVGWPVGETVYGIQVQRALFVPMLRDIVGGLLRDVVSRVPVVFQNAVADIPVLAKAFDIQYQHYKRIDDTMLAHALLWSEWPHTLEFLASIYGQYPKLKHLAATDALLYNFGDIIETVSVWQALQKELALDGRVARVYESQSLPLIPHLIAAHARGIRVNHSRVVPASAQLSNRLADSTRLASAHAGFPINVGSDDQIAHWLYTVEGLPTQTHKKTRRPTIDADAIAALRQHVGPAPDLEGEEREGLGLDNALLRVESGANPVLESRVIYAAAQQSLSHYIKPCYKDGELVGRLYPQFKIHAQASGRWSTTDPPMAQLPSDLRDIVCPDEGCAWIIFDWDGIELRLMATLAQDQPYLLAFAQGWDVHTLNACTLFQLPLPPDRVDPHRSAATEAWRELVSWQGKDDTRRVFAKRFNFRLNYGGDPKKAGDIPGAQLLGLTPLKLVKASENLLAAHPAIATWRRQAAQDARQNGVSYTFMGRRRRLLGEGKAIEREAFNHPLQGGVADMFNITFLAIVDALPYVEFMFQLHDSFYWQVPLAQVDVAEETIRRIAEREWDVYGTAMTVPVTMKRRLV